MHFRILFTVMSAFLLVAVPLAAQDAKKPGDAKPDVKKPAVPAKNVLNWRALPNYSGEVTGMKDGNISVRFKQKLVVPVRDAAKRKFDYQRSYANYQRQVLQRQNDMRRRLFDIQRQTNPQTRARLINEYQRQLRQRPPQPPRPPQLFEQKEITKDVDLVPGKKMIIRTANLEPEFDDKGFPVKQTPEYVAKKRGPEGYPGFPGFLGNLGRGTQVQVFLQLPNGKKQKKSTNIADILGGKAPGAGVDGNPNLPRIAMIVIVPDNRK